MLRQRQPQTPPQPPTSILHLTTMESVIASSLPMPSVSPVVEAVARTLVVVVRTPVVTATAVKYKQQIKKDSPNGLLFDMVKPPLQNKSTICFSEEYWLCQYDFKIKNQSTPHQTSFTQAKALFQLHKNLLGNSRIKKKVIFPAPQNEKSQTECRLSFSPLPSVFPRSPCLSPRCWTLAASSRMSTTVTLAACSSRRPVFPAPLA